MIRLFMVFIIFSALPVQAAEVQVYVINKETFQKVHLEHFGDIQSVVKDLEYPKNEEPLVFIYDFNNDGINDYLVQSYKSLCGNGGCVYQIIDGKSGHSLGELFGNPLIVIKAQSNKSFPDFESYAHLGADSGEFATYRLVGKRYEVISRKELRSEEIDALTLRVKNLPRLDSK